MEMDFGSEENASIVYTALAVDKEVTVLRHDLSNVLPIIFN